MSWLPGVASTRRKPHFWVVNRQNLIETIHQHQPLRIGLHALFWLAFYGVNYYVNVLTFDPFSHTAASYLSPLRTTASLVGVYYPLVYYVLPRWLLPGKLAKATLAIGVLIVVYALLDYAFEQLLYQQCTECNAILRQSMPDYYAFLQTGVVNVLLARLLTVGIVFQLLTAIAIPVGLTLSLAYVRQQFQSLKLAQENTQLEFSFLRAQVNPHFLFNTLNNIYGLILADRQRESAETVARLADFMRYTLYDTSAETKSLTTEIQLLTDYIALEKLRLNNTDVTFQHETDQATYQIAPLLFVPAVENAFKYCTEEPGRSSWIRVQLIVRDGQLRFTVSNTYAAQERSLTKGGIGLVNLRKRLAHHYPDRHQLTIVDEPPVYTLTIELDDL